MRFGLVRKQFQVHRQRVKPLVDALFAVIVCHRFMINRTSAARQLPQGFRRLPRSLFVSALRRGSAMYSPAAAVSSFLRA